MMDSFWANIKQFVNPKNGLSQIGITNIVGSGTTAIFWFYIASVINPEQYGEIHYFIGIAGMAQLISLISTTNVLTVYGAKNIKIHSTLFLISLVMGFVSFIVVFLLTSKIEVSFLILGYIIFELSNGLLLGRKLFVKYAKIFLLQKFLTLSLGILFYYTFDVEGILFALVISYVPSIWIIIREFKENRIDFSLLKPRRGFLINNYGINISTAVGGQIDKLIVAPLLGFDLLGNYSLALQIFVVLMILPNIIFKYMLTQEASGRDIQKLKKYTLILSIGLSILGIFLAPEIIPALFPEYEDVIIAVQIISIIVVPSTISLFYESKFLSLEKSKFLIISRIIMVGITVSGFVILGPIFGIVGLASSLVLSSISSTCYLVIVDKIILN